MRKLLTYLLFFLFFTSCALFILSLLPGSFREGKVIVLQKGSLLEVAADLEQAGLIKSKYLFFPNAKCFNFFSKLKAGEYKFPARSSILDIILIMQKGEYVKRFITIPEGLTTSQIIELVNKNEYLSGRINSIAYQEGSLLPDTYMFTYAEDRAKLLNRMKEAMHKALDAVWETRDKTLPFTNKKELLVLASIVEEEAKLDEERPQIARVFINRLNKKMKLDADPTTIYAITSGKYVLQRPLNKSDLKFISLFNTYVTSGLPPAPISNPGIKSIMAVAHPVTSDALYFVVKDCKGRHNFSNNIKDHNINVGRYKKLVCNLGST